ncbi:hypothetical protein L2E82_27856 [Cichorium intybus]|uniref:Uncharacterized protein n=1 Tax=Cichorium intybus TaxID=13427 RepID=A0ACB9CU03_CICIN|nr:hypothetical protein L2E82_27856 [Cichorium intybus]
MTWQVRGVENTISFDGGSERGLKCGTRECYFKISLCFDTSFLVYTTPRGQCQVRSRYQNPLSSGVDATFDFPLYFYFSFYIKNFSLSRLTHFGSRVFFKNL